MSRREDWETPQWLYDTLNAEFNFGVDAAATKKNSKARFCITPEEDSLHVNWVAVADAFYHGKNRVIWLNPPYGRSIKNWMEKAYYQSQRGAKVVCLVPASVGTNWWWNWCLKATEIRFIKGRLKFEGAPAGAQFPSAVVIFDGHSPYTRIYWWNVVKERREKWQKLREATSSNL